MWSRLAMCIMNSNIQNSAYITLTNTLENEKKNRKKKKKIWKYSIYFFQPLLVTLNYTVDHNNTTLIILKLFDTAQQKYQN